MKIGLLGGTFNPIHIGHIRLAQEASKILDLDKVVFIPAYRPPHKRDCEEIISWQHRYAMMRLALEGKDNFEISDIELRRKGTSYSVDTIEQLRVTYSANDQLFFITGSDAIKDLNTWKDIDRLKKLCTFVIATRPSFEITSLPKHIIIINVDTPDISSSEIRRRIKNGEPFETLVPPKAYDYIISKKLYL